MPYEQFVKIGTGGPTRTFGQVYFSLKLSGKELSLLR